LNSDSKKSFIEGLTFWTLQKRCLYYLLMVRLGKDIFRGQYLKIIYWRGTIGSQGAHWVWAKNLPFLGNRDYAEKF